MRMGFGANRRIANWLEGLKHWALQEEKSHGAHSKEAEYSIGVILAVMHAQGHGKPLSESELRNRPSEETFGYLDAQALIQKVLVLGDAPTGAYADLIALPTSNPLTK